MSSDEPMPDDPDVPDGPDAPEYCAYTTYEEGDAPESVPRTGADADGIEAAVWDAVREVEDPEMPVSVVDLGLVYDVTVEGDRATVDMTLTYTGCPARDLLIESVRNAAASARGIEEAEVRLVWSPEWTVDMVTDRGKAQLREFGLSV